MYMVYDVSIIGSGPAGLSAAICCDKANLSAIVIEKEYEGTGQIAESDQVDNYLGMPGISGYDLGETFREHAVKLEVEFLEQEVTRIQKEESGQFQMDLLRQFCYQIKTVIYAAGASRKTVLQEKECTERCFLPCDLRRILLPGGEKVAVLGGGDTALDDAGYLAGLAEQVYVIHRRKRKEFQQQWSTVKKLKKKKVTFVLEHQVKEITGKAKVTGVVLEDGTVIDVDGVFSLRIGSARHW